MYDINMESRYVFGPTPSRRLGRSLGIDPVPLKTCNWNCVYCQLGRSTPLVNDRRDYHPTDEILAEVRDVLDRHDPGQIDWVTFVGSGEPLLHEGLGTMIREVKAMTELPVAVCTNGSLLFLPDVREAVRVADAVLPTVSAGSPELYRRINRPHPDVPYESHIGGIIVFSHEYEGELWPEVMLIKGVNDTEAALLGLRSVLRQMRPGKVHITLPNRATAETWVEPPDEDGLLRAMAILGDVAHVVPPTGVEFDLSGYADVVDAAAAIIERHPMREDELERVLTRFGSEAVTQALADLESGGRVKVVERFGVRFWCPAASYYPDEEKSRRTAPKGP
jgi:wyosine [tRNA(Phe)-imidazoG37] synthetase (radical SAM superfamily)